MTIESSGAYLPPEGEDTTPRDLQVVPPPELVFSIYPAGLPEQGSDAEEEHRLLTKLFNEAYREAIAAVARLSVEEIPRLWEKYEDTPPLDAIDALDRSTPDKASVNHIRRATWLLLEKHGR